VATAAAAPTRGSADAAPVSSSTGRPRRRGPPRRSGQRSRHSGGKGPCLPDPREERRLAAAVCRAGLARRRPPAAAGGGYGGGRGAAAALRLRPSRPPGSDAGTT
jgi:hypothetical protein